MEANLLPVWRNPDKIFSALSIFWETFKQQNEWLMQRLILREHCGEGGKSFLLSLFYFGSFEALGEHMLAGREKEFSFF